MECRPWAYEQRDLPGEAYSVLFGWKLFVLLPRETVFAAEWHWLFCYDELLTVYTGHQLQMLHVADLALIDDSHFQSLGIDSTALQRHFC